MSSIIFLYSRPGYALIELFSDAQRTFKIRIVQGVNHLNFKDLNNFDRIKRILEKKDLYKGPEDRRRRHLTHSEISRRHVNHRHHQVRAYWTDTPTFR